LTRDGVGALWATHLIDEVAEGDDVAVLHRGAILAAGRVARVVADTNSSDIGAAFGKLVGASEDCSEVPP
jgi:ABC-2 type transport system ATP-binding protein